MTRGVCDRRRAHTCCWSRHEGGSGLFEVEGLRCARIELVSGDLVGSGFGMHQQVVLAVQQLPRQARILIAQSLGAGIHPAHRAGPLLDFDLPADTGIHIEGELSMRILWCEAPWIDSRFAMPSLRCPATGVSSRRMYRSQQPAMRYRSCPRSGIEVCFPSRPTERI